MVHFSRKVCLQVFHLEQTLKVSVCASEKDNIRVPPVSAVVVDSSPIGLTENDFHSS